MNRFPPSRINPLVGIAAVAMTALTFVVAVGVPSSIAPTSAGATINAKAAPASIEIAILPAIEVIGMRDASVANGQGKPRG
jgi:hypothetical protein